MDGVKWIKKVWMGRKKVMNEQKSTEKGWVKTSVDG